MQGRVATADALPQLRRLTAGPVLSGAAAGVSDYDALMMRRAHHLLARRLNNVGGIYRRRSFQGECAERCGQD
jgi:hypothetical protein